MLRVIAKKLHFSEHCVLFFNNYIHSIHKLHLPPGEWLIFLYLGKYQALLSYVLASKLPFVPNLPHSPSLCNFFLLDKIMHFSYEMFMGTPLGHKFSRTMDFEVKKRKSL